MSQTRHIRYTVEVTLAKGVATPSEWRMKQTPAQKNHCIPAHGAATVENLKAYCLGVEASTHPGGVNAHLGVTVILAARIRDHKTGEVLATYARA